MKHRDNKYVEPIVNFQSLRKVSVSRSEYENHEL